MLSGNIFAGGKSHLAGHVTLQYSVRDDTPAVEMYAAVFCYFFASILPSRFEERGRDLFMMNIRKTGEIILKNNYE